MRALFMFVIVLALCISLTSAARHVRPEQSAATPLPTYTPTTYIWPLPQSVSQGSLLRTVNYNVAFTSTPPFPDLDAAIARFKAITFQHRAVGDVGVSAVAMVEVQVKDISAPLQMGVDESYTVSIPQPNATSPNVAIVANTYYGALHALETLSQLITFDFPSSTYSIANTPWTIHDAPRFPHRGLMVDTARHYQTIPVLRTIIDSLAYSKYNVFHWHLSDVQSFPYHSDVLPRLSNAAYSAAERYSTADVVDLVEYARQRGVRVMVEFDIPGHAASWCVGYPEVCPFPTCLTPLDPSSNATFALMERLFTELTGGRNSAGLLPEDLFHLGGDEVDLSCWTEVEHVKQWLAAQNMTTKDAYRYMVERAHSYIYQSGRTPVNWDEVYQNFGKTIDPSTIIHVWHDGPLLGNITRDGFRVIYRSHPSSHHRTLTHRCHWHFCCAHLPSRLSRVYVCSPDDWPAWYLDSLYSLWSDMYTMEPEKWTDTPEQAALIIGGESCMWGETVDASDILPTIWPRAAAVAERLWSDKSVNDVSAAEPRYAYFRCLLNRRGINAGPYDASEARQAPDGPGSCLEQ